jgi:hypothetical protein
MSMALLEYVAQWITPMGEGGGLLAKLHLLSSKLDFDEGR